MVIDEEQRFGVKQKETIKKLARQVDILTLTATPIPRTLHLALSGARSMSVIKPHLSTENQLKQSLRAMT